MHTNVLKLKQVYSLAAIGITVLNNNNLKLFIRTYMAQASSCFKCLDTCIPIHTTPTFITEVPPTSCYLCASALNDCQKAT